MRIGDARGVFVRSLIATFCDDVENEIFDREMRKTLVAPFFFPENMNSAKPAPFSTKPTRMHSMHTGAPVAHLGTLAPSRIYDVHRS